MSAAGHDHDTTVVGKALQKRGDQNEVADVIGEELKLVTVFLLQLGERHDPRIANDCV